jgi:hypothetical protein
MAESGRITNTEWNSTWESFCSGIRGLIKVAVFNVPPFGLQWLIPQIANVPRVHTAYYLIWAALYVVGFCWLDYWSLKDPATKEARITPVRCAIVTAAQVTVVYVAYLLNLQR